MPVMNPPRNSKPLSPRLSVYRWQSPMLASLAHRASGIVLALFVPVYLFLLTGLTSSPTDFTRTVGLMHSLPGKLVLWLTGTALIYHLFNGLRFLFLDAGWIDGREAMRRSALIGLGLGVLGSLGLAVFLW